MNKEKYHPLRSSTDLDPLMEAISDRKVVMLGEASHGTSEYYTWRTAISRRLIEEKGFNFIVVEGDWPDCYALNRYAKHLESAAGSALEAQQVFERWPSWMWANWEVNALIEWMHQYNRHRPEGERAGFYGLDVYSLFESLQEILQYLQQHEPDAVDAAKEAFQCFAPYHRDPQRYARATASLVPHTCAQEVVRLLGEVRNKVGPVMVGEEEEFDAEQNALVTVNAERYYRAMVQGGPQSWNVRDHHMMQTLDRLMHLHGPEAKGIVWAHNTHIGDASATDMAADGMINIGQMGRENYGRENVFLVGFGGYEGTVVAGTSWGAEPDIMAVPQGETQSLEAYLHRLGSDNKLLLADDWRDSEIGRSWIGHRAIGVVYRPEYERFGNYVPTRFTQRYDAFLYFDRTRALHAIPIEHPSPEEPELYPWNY